MHHGYATFSSGALSIDLIIRCWLLLLLLRGRERERERERERSGETTMDYLSVCLSGLLGFGSLDRLLNPDFDLDLDFGHVCVYMCDRIFNINYINLLLYAFVLPAVKEGII